MRGGNAIMIVVLIGGAFAMWLDFGLDVNTPVVYWFTGGVTGSLAILLAMKEVGH